VINHHALQWIPTVAKVTRVVFSSFQQTRHGVSSPDDGNIIGIQETVHPEAIVQLAWRFIVVVNTMLVAELMQVQGLISGTPLGSESTLGNIQFRSSLSQVFLKAQFK
jgi:hypothetical protein